MKKSFPLLLAAMAAASSMAAAETDGTMVVTATRTAQSPSETLVPVIVISGDELQRLATFDIAEALRLQAGIEIGRNGGPGQAASVFLRGTNSNHAVVLIDGVRINPGTLGGAALHNIRPQDIERIEIVKGPRSALYGTEAIGGVINIITRRAQAPFAADLGLGAGSYGTRDLGAGVRLRGERWSGGLRMGRLSSDGFPPQRGSTVDRGHDNRTLNAHLGTRFGHTGIELRHWEARGNTEYLDFFLTPVDQDFLNRVTSMALSHQWTEKVHTRLLWSRAVDDIAQSQSTDFAKTRRDTFDLQADILFGAGLQVTTGLVTMHERTEAEVFGAGFSERPGSRALFLQVQGGDDQRRWAMAARHLDHDAFGRHTVWNAEFGQRLSGNWRLTAGAGTAFRAPDSTQRFGFGGNPALAPERSLNIELGLRGQVGAHSRVEWNFYRNRIEDLVTFDLATFALANIDRARIRGTELVHTLSRGRWEWRQALVLQDPVDLDSGDTLPRRARRSATTTVRFAASESLDLGADLLATSRRKDSGFGPDTIPGYALVNLNAQWRIYEDWSVDFRLENVLDRDYETALGFPQAGRSVHLRVNWSD